jgi:hypothetical protein
MDIATVLRVLSFVGTETPAFLQLFNAVKSTFSISDQITLDTAYAKARIAADQAHNGAQA